MHASSQLVGPETGCLVADLVWLILSYIFVKCLMWILCSFDLDLNLGYKSFIILPYTCCFNFYLRGFLKPQTWDRTPVDKTVKMPVFSACDSTALALVLFLHLYELSISEAETGNQIVISSVNFLLTWVFFFSLFFTVQLLRQELSCLNLAEVTLHQSHPLDFLGPAVKTRSSLFITKATFDFSSQTWTYLLEAFSR